MPIDITIVGGGMIVHDQILPSLYHLQRTGVVGDIQAVATSSARMRDLINDRFANAVPGQSFTAYPDPSEDPSKRYNDLYKQVIPKMKPRQMVVIATPDQLHYEMVKFALEHDQHVLCVKPLVQTMEHAIELEKLARERGLFVGVEYHKRFDRRSLEAREQYRKGRFGEFKLGEAKLMEPYYYRHSNFQNWFTKENSDPFTYVGCHYVDAVYFITGLRPVEVSVRGVEGTFPNGNVGYLWSSGTVRFENGGVLNVLNGLGYPDDAAGGNDQGMRLFCEGQGKGATIEHNDQFRGVSHCYLDKDSGAHFRYVNPDYFRLVPWVGDGLKPVGYGYESIEGNVMAAAQLEDATANLAGDEALAKRQQLLETIDEKGIIATPGNSYINELVTEAARLSIAADGQHAVIEDGDTPSVRLRG